MEAEIKKTNTLKIVELGLQDRLYSEMREPTFSASAFSKKLQSEGINISPQSIRKFMMKTKDAQKILIQNDLKASNDLIKLSMDYNKALKDILTEVTEVKNAAKDEKDFITYNQLVGKLLQGIELFAKLTGDIKPKQNVDIKNIYIQINDDIEKNMKHVRGEMFNKVIDVDYEIVEEDKQHERDITIE